MDQILIIDDHEHIRKTMGYFLETLGYKVKTACNGKQGIDYFNEIKNFKVVITDIQMPIMNGNEVAKQIRESERPNIPIIAITGCTDAYDIDNGLFDFILHKPFSMSSLSNLIKTHF